MHYSLGAGRLHHNRPTCDIQDNSGDPGGIIRSEKERRLCYIFRCPQLFYRVGTDEGAFLFIRDLLLVALGQNCFGCNTVCPDAIRSGLGSQVLCKELNTCLGSSVRDR